MNDTVTPTSAAPLTKTPAEMVAEYIGLRDDMQVANERFAELVKERYGDRMKELEAQLLDLLNTLGSDSLSSKAGTVYKKLTTSVTIGDKREFQRHVIGTEHWELADWRANKTAIEDLLEKGEPLPPGVNRSSIFTVGIRRKS